MSDKIKQAIENNAEEAREFLKSMIRFESTPGNERSVAEYVKDGFMRTGCEVELTPVPQEIVKDPEYSFSDQSLEYEGRANVVAIRRGIGGGRSVILQSHLDVVPAGDWAEAFTPVDNGDFIVGRGAADAKGQISTIWLVMKALNDLGFSLKGNIEAQAVIEEEVGGNGALALIRQGHRADAVIVLEGSELHIHPANRGAIWFRIELEGLPTHMGRKTEGISAVDLSVKVINALYDYEKTIIADSANYPGFERYASPVQVNIGILHAGSWPSQVAANAVIEGGVGFLPNRSMEQVKKEVKETIDQIDDAWLRDHYKLSFPKLHNDSYEIPYDHPAVLALEKATQESGICSETFGWNVSCDARLYAKVGGMPTIVFGPGSVSEAHARGEKIAMSDIKKAAEAIVRFVVDWCGG
ncbi:MAG: ArgE/DapE family deacylase [Armatimonadetes bacterium]|nr:ArgE/DapE family deacylase [Armatimonadota bacterium]